MSSPRTAAQSVWPCGMSWLHQTFDGSFMWLKIETWAAVKQWTTPSSLHQSCMLGIKRPKCLICKIYISEAAQDVQDLMQSESEWKLWNPESELLQIFTGVLLLSCSLKDIWETCDFHSRGTMKDKTKESGSSSSSSSILRCLRRLQLTVFNLGEWTLEIWNLLLNLMGWVTHLCYDVKKNLVIITVFTWFISVACVLGLKLDVRLCGGRPDDTQLCLACGFLSSGQQTPSQ